jgi:hypothetical protein
MQDNYIYTSQNCSYENNVSFDDLLEMANNIWKEVKKELKKTNDLDSLYIQFFDKYKDFGKSFPIILRWMVQMQSYSEKAFKKFLIKYSNANIQNKKDFLILQADYIVYLYEESKHYKKQEVVNYKEFIIKQLLEEDSMFDKIQEEYKIQEKEDKDTALQNCRQKLYNYLSK